jgi:hypothetical protein
MPLGRRWQAAHRTSGCVCLGVSQKALPDVLISLLQWMYRSCKFYV